MYMEPATAKKRAAIGHGPQHRFWILFVPWPWDHDPRRLSLFHFLFLSVSLFLSEQYHQQQWENKGLLIRVMIVPALYTLRKFNWCAIAYSSMWLNFNHSIYLTEFPPQRAFQSVASSVISSEIRQHFSNSVPATYQGFNPQGHR